MTVFDYVVVHVKGIPQAYKVVCDHRMRNLDVIADVIYSHRINDFLAFDIKEGSLLNLHNVVDSLRILIVPLAEEKDDLLRVFCDFVREEEYFLGDLDTLITDYLPLIRQYLDISDSFEALEWLHHIYQGCKFICTRARGVINNWDKSPPRICDCFKRDYWNILYYYQANFPIIYSYIHKTLRKNHKFRFACRQKTTSQASILSLIHRPLSRIRDYLIVLRKLIDLSSETEKFDLRLQLNSLEGYVEAMEKSEGSRHNELKLCEIENMFPRDNLRLHAEERSTKKSGFKKISNVIRGPSRSRSSSVPRGSGLPSNPSLKALDSCYITEETVYMVVDTKRSARHLFLFNDCLLIARKRQLHNDYKLEKKVLLSDMWISSDNCCGQNLNLGWPLTNTKLEFSSPTIKAYWLTCLKSAMPCFSSDMTTPAVLDVYLLNTGSLSPLKPFKARVTSSDTVSDLFEILENEDSLRNHELTDSQMFSVSMKDYSTFLLQGYERPHAIKSFYESKLVDEEVACVFCVISNQSSIPAAKELAAMIPSRLQTRRRNTLDNFFKKFSHTVDAVDSEPIAKKFFGVPLQEVCPNTQLPPVLLTLLQGAFNGRNIEGIFRKSANYKAKAALKLSIASDDEIKWDYTQCGLLVIAEVLKDFLRDLPDCLLTTASFDQWVHSLELSKNDRLSYIRGIMKFIPKTNYILASRLFVMLHSVVESQKDWQANNLTPETLSVCIAHNILFRSKSEIDDFKDSKIRDLIEYIIANTKAIFQEDYDRIYSEYLSSIDDDVLTLESSSLSTKRHRSPTASHDSGIGFSDTLTCGGSTENLYLEAQVDKHQISTSSYSRPSRRPNSLWLPRENHNISSISLPSEASSSFLPHRSLTEPHLNSSDLLSKLDTTFRELKQFNSNAKHAIHKRNSSIRHKPPTYEDHLAKYSHKRSPEILPSKVSFPPRQNPFVSFSQPSVSFHSSRVNRSLSCDRRQKQFQSFDDSKASLI